MPAHELPRPAYCCPVIRCHRTLHCSLPSVPDRGVCTLFLIFQTSPFNLLCLSFLICKELRMEPGPRQLFTCKGCLWWTSVSSPHFSVIYLLLL